MIRTTVVSLGRFKDQLVWKRPPPSSKQMRRTVRIYKMRTKGKDGSGGDDKGDDTLYLLQLNDFNSRVRTSLDNPRPRRPSTRSVHDDDDDGDGGD